MVVEKNSPQNLQKRRMVLAKTQSASLEWNENPTQPGLTMEREAPINKETVDVMWLSETKNHQTKHTQALTCKNWNQTTQSNPSNISLLGFVHASVCLLLPFVSYLRPPV